MVVVMLILFLCVVFMSLQKQAARAAIAPALLSQSRLRTTFVVCGHRTLRHRRPCPSGVAICLRALRTTFRPIELLMAYAANRGQALGLCIGSCSCMCRPKPLFKLKKGEVMWLLRWVHGAASVVKQTDTQQGRNPKYIMQTFGVSHATA